MKKSIWVNVSLQPSLNQKKRIKLTLNEEDYNECYKQFCSLIKAKVLRPCVTAMCLIYTGEDDLYGTGTELGDGNDMEGMLHEFPEGKNLRVIVVVDDSVRKISKIVPADFGIENLYCTLHGNITVLLQNKEKMQANSIILSLNSSVFASMFLDLEVSTVEMDDFHKDAVRIFLESLYTGTVKLEKQYFRDMNKMANVFKVSWLMSHCDHYFCSSVDRLEDSDFGETLFFFEEARYVKSSFKKTGYLDIIVSNIAERDVKEHTFVERYMANYLLLTTQQIDLMIQIVGENVQLFLKIIKRNMTEQGRAGGAETTTTEQGVTLHQNTNYLLQKIDLVVCREKDAALYEEVFDWLLDNVDRIPAEDARMLCKIYRDTAKRERLRTHSAQEAAGGDVTITTRDVTISTQKTDDKQIVPTSETCPSIIDFRNVPYSYIPNLYHSFEKYWDLKVDALLDALGTSPDVKNLYMFLEAVEMRLRKTSTLGRFFGAGIRAEKIVLIMQAKGWSRVRPEFLDSFRRLKSMIQGWAELVSDTESTRIECTELVNIKELAMQEKVYKFYFERPSDVTMTTPANQSRCTNPTQCGFLIKVVPATAENPGSKPENPGSFSMKLVKAAELYPVDIHCHADGISLLDNLHLVMECSMDQEWVNTCLTWSDKPVYNEQRNVIVLHMDKSRVPQHVVTGTVKLVVYY